MLSIQLSGAKLILYKDNSNMYIRHIDVPNVTCCNNVLCVDKHSSDLEQYHDRVIHVCMHVMKQHVFPFRSNKLDRISLVA